MQSDQIIVLVHESWELPANKETHSSRSRGVVYIRRCTLLLQYLMIPLSGSLPKDVGQEPKSGRTGLTSLVKATKRFVMHSIAYTLQEQKEPLKL